MGEVIVVTSASGGAGKTFLTAGLGGAFSARNKNVLLLDAGLGWPSLDLSVGAADTVVYDLFDVLEGKCRIGEGIKEIPGAPGLYLLPAPRHESSPKASPERFLKLAGLLKQKFDVILIDLPCRETALREAVLGLADRILLVTEGLRASVRSTKKLLQALPEEPKKSLILNRVHTELLKAGDMMSVEAVVAELKIPLLGAVRYDTELMLRDEEGSIWDCRKDSAGRAFVNIAGRLSGENIPIDLRKRH